jgi:T-complex protein 1 subunit eta
LYFKGGKWWGVDIVNEGICNTFETAVWEPVLVKSNAITAATEAACLILSVDETIKNEPSEKPDTQPLPGPRPGAGRGRGRMMR